MYGKNHTLSLLHREPRFLYFKQDLGLMLIFRPKAWWGIAAGAPKGQVLFGTKLQLCGVYVATRVSARSIFQSVLDVNWLSLDICL